MAMLPLVLLFLSSNVLAYEQRASCHADETLRTARDCYKIVDGWRGDGVDSVCKNLVSIEDDKHWWQLKTAIEKALHNSPTDEYLLTAGARHAGGAWSWSNSGRVLDSRLAQLLVDHMSSRRDDDILVVHYSAENRRARLIVKRRGDTSIAVRSLCRRRILSPTRSFPVTSAIWDQSTPTLTATKQPQDAVVYTHGGDHYAAALQCSYGAHTQPPQWYHETNVQPLNATRHTIITNTRLILLNNSADSALYGQYHCALNVPNVGIARSAQAVLRRAYALPFEQSRLDSYTFEGSGYRLDCNAPDHFPRGSEHYAFAWTFGGADRYVKQSARVFVSGDGSLYFAHVLAEDNGDYACSLIDERLATGVIGPTFSLHVQESPHGSVDNFAPTIDSDFPKVYPSAPQLRHSGFTLECFAHARPAAAYTWRRIEPDGSMNEITIGVIDDGRRLRATQHGTYECAAHNMLGVARARRTIVFDSMPIITHEKSTVRVEEGSVAKVECPHWARPAARVEWYRDDTPISPLLLSDSDKTRFSIGKNRLSIVNATVADTGVYTCTARNEHGAAAASTVLHIEAMAPRFALLDNWPLRVRVEAGAEALLPCPVVASRPLHVLWRREGRVINLRNRHQQKMHSGIPTLHIVPTIASDSGTYTCLAANTYGTTQHEIELHVHEHLHARVTSDSADGDAMVATATNNVMLRCLGSDAPCADYNCTEHAFVWWHNGEPLTARPQLAEAVIVSAHHGSLLTIDAVDRRHEGLYTCRIETAAGRTAHTIAVTVINDSQLRQPKPPEISIVNDKIFVDLAIQTDAYYYQLQVSSTGDAWMDILTQQLPTAERHARQVLNRSAIAAATYCGTKVIWRHRYGTIARRWSPWSATASTSTIQVHTPRILDAYLDRNASVAIIKWQPIAAHHRHTIEWWLSRETPTTGTIMRLPVAAHSNAAAVEFLTQWHTPVVYARHCDDDDIHYVHVRVVAYDGNNNNTIAQSEVHRLPLVIANRVHVQKLQLVNVTDTTLALRWKHDGPSHESKCDERLVTELHCRCTDKCLTQNVRAFSSGTEHTLHNLEPSTEYECVAKVWRLSTVFSNVVRALTIASSDKAETSRPYNVRIGPVDQDSAMMQWRVHDVADILSYEIDVYEGRAASKPQRLSISAPGDWPRVLLDNLVPMRHYRARVRAVLRASSTTAAPYTQWSSDVRWQQTRVTTRSAYLAKH